MAPHYLLAIDQGTTNTKALLVDVEGRVVARASRPLAVSYPQAAWVEQDPLALWQSVQDAVDECIQEAPNLAAVAVTNQRESVVLWERASGRPLGPCVIWQCQRGADFCRELSAQGLESKLRERTGLTIDPMFSASKMRWLLQHTPNGLERAAAGELCLGTVDSWVLFNLTGGRVHTCDVTNASRTQLFALETLQWDAELLDLFGIPLAALPEVKASSAIYGETVGHGKLPAGIPIATMIGDSHGALFGHAGFQPGAIKATYGTGSSLMTPTPSPVISQRGLSTTVAWGYASSAARLLERQAQSAARLLERQAQSAARLLERQAGQVTYALEGNIYVTGAAVEWYGQLLGLDQPAQAVEALAATVPDAEGVYLVPAFVGLGAPHWQSGARGLITGLTRGSTSAHLARATLESIAYQVRDVFDVMQAEAGSPLQVLLADGGASQNDLLMQFQADIIGCPVLRSSSSDVSALGAAYLAGLAVGLWRSEAEIAALPRPHDRFEPRMAEAERAARNAGWQAAVSRSVFTP